MPLTTRQKKFYSHLREFFSEHGKPPKLIELREWLEKKGWGEIQSLNSLTQYLLALERNGKIRREGTRRGITLLGGCETVNIPILSSPATCGSPTIMLDENIHDYHKVSSSLIKDEENTYIFCASGDSMNEASIENGDFVLVERTNNIQDGDIVLATIDGCSTIKRLRQGPGTITLIPESSNTEHKPIYLGAADDFVISGKITHILKN